MRLVCSFRLLESPTVLRVRAWEQTPYVLKHNTCTKNNCHESVISFTTKKLYIGNQVIHENVHCSLICMQETAESFQANP